MDPVLAAGNMRGKVSFLRDPEDTIAVCKSCRCGDECVIHDAGMSVLTQQLGQVEQVEMIDGLFVCVCIFTHDNAAYL